MKRFVLASQGFTTQEIIDGVAELVGKPAADISVAIINESHVGIAPGRDKKWMFNEMSQVAENFGGAVSLVSLLVYDIAAIKEQLEFADLIYIVGGKAGVLPKLFRDTGFDQILNELSETKVIMGTSAGSYVLGKQIENPDYWVDQYGDTEPHMSWPNLGLVDFNILPHWGREDSIEKRNTERLTPLLKDNPFPLYGIRDDQAVVYREGHELEFLGGEPAAIFGSAAD